MPIHKAPRSHDRDAPMRTARLAELLRQELDAIFRDELNDPHFHGVRICALELRGAVATVHLGVAQGTHAALTLALQRATPFVRVRLCQALNLERTPQLRFVCIPSAVEVPHEPA